MPDTLTMDHSAIHTHLANRFPYLFVDAASEVVPGQSAKGYKNLTINEWFFQTHFAGDPLMPGTLQIEALTQLGALALVTLPDHAGRVIYLSRVNNVKLLRKVVPGDRLDMEATVHSYRRGVGKLSATGHVSGELACCAEWTATVVEEIAKYSRSQTDD